MKLRLQLGLVSLTLLLVPWAGCAFLAENERALQQAQSQAAIAVAATTAAALSERIELLYPYPEVYPEATEGSLLTHPLVEAPRIDGWFDDWEAIPARRFGHRHRSISVRAGHFGQRLYLAVAVEEPAPRYRSPQQTEQFHSDQLHIRWADERANYLSIAPEGPGRVPVRVARSDGTVAGSAEGTQAWWQEVAGGYHIELALDASLLRGRLAIEYLGIDDTGRDVLTNQPTAANLPPRLIAADPQLNRWLDQVVQPGMQLQVFDRWQWPLGSAGSHELTEPSSTFWLLRWLYRALLPEPALSHAPETDESGRIVSPLLVDQRGSASLIKERGSPILTATAPVSYLGDIAGVVMVSQSAEQFLSLTDGAFASLLGRGLLMLGVSATALLGFAALTSWRIRRLILPLSHQRGRHEQAPKLPITLLNDEIDALASKFNQQLAELADYQRYLTSLNQTLAHELRTPVAIVASSLDNLDSADLSSQEQASLLSRAREGISRLQALFAALQEARRLEQAIAAESMVDTDLCALLKTLIDAYSQTYRERHFELDTALQHAPANVAPEQIVQALDKLVDNARSYAPEDTVISLRLEGRGIWWRLSVANEGPLLPEVESRALFEPLISHRGHQDRTQHMGLGLHIVRLIAQNHGGEPFANNVPDGSGVVIGFSVRADINPQKPSV